MAALFPSFESRMVAIDGVNIHYVCGGSGSRVVLMHGVGSSAAVELCFNLEPVAADDRVFASDLSDVVRSDTTLLIWGRHDHIVPASHAEIAKGKLRNGRVEIFENSGHTPQMEEPDRLNRLVLDFLSEPASRRGEGVA